MSRITSPIRYVALGPRVHDAEWVPKHGMPSVFDLSWLTGIDQGGTFKLHSRVNGEHKHEGPFNYSLYGGMLISAIKNSQGHFAEFVYVGPAVAAVEDDSAQVSRSTDSSNSRARGESVGAG